MCRSLKWKKKTPFAFFSFGWISAQPFGLARLRQTIEHAKEDENIKGIYLNVTLPGTGYTVIEEIRQALIDFKTSGKWVIAYSDLMTESAILPGLSG